MRWNGSTKSAFQLFENIEQYKGWVKIEQGEVLNTWVRC